MENSAKHYRHQNYIKQKNKILETMIKILRSVFVHGGRNQDIWPVNLSQSVVVKTNVG